jgi:hypothetical protein
MKWPDLRFEKFYESFQRRKIIEELTLRKIMVGSAVYGNPNYDGEDNKGKREQWIAALEEQFQEQVKRLFDPTRVDKEKQIMEKDPFFQAMERGLAKQGVPTLEDTLE